MKVRIRIEGIGLLFVLLGALALSTNRVSLAAENTQQLQQQTESPVPLALKEDELKQVSGRVASVNPQERMLMVKRGPFPVVSAQFLTDWRTIIANGGGGQRLSLGDLRQGQIVKVEYILKDGKNLARSITVQEKEYNKG